MVEGEAIARTGTFFHFQTASDAALLTSLAYTRPLLAECLTIKIFAPFLYLSGGFT